MNDAVESRQVGWKDKPPPERAWRGRQGRTRKAIVAEQDRAAGGREGRYVKRKDGDYALASITLKLLPRTRRIRAYLRWSENGRSPALYVGEVEHPTRAANLEQAWQIAKDRGWSESVLFRRGRGRRPLPRGHRCAGTEAATRHRNSESAHCCIAKVCATAYRHVRFPEYGEPPTSSSPVLVSPSS